MGAFDNIRAKIQSQLATSLDSFLDMIEKDAKQIVVAAAESKEAKNRSFNMLDAYGYAIYYNGKKLRFGYANDMAMSKRIHKGWPKHNIPANDGRGYLESFFSEYKPRTKGIEMVVVNAVYYASILESGKGYGGAEFRIISQIEGRMEDLANKYKGRVRFFAPGQ